MTRTTTLAALAFTALLTLGLVAAGCSSTDSGSKGPGGGSSKADTGATAKADSGGGPTADAGMKPDTAPATKDQLISTICAVTAAVCKTTTAAQCEKTIRDARKVPAATDVACIRKAKNCADTKVCFDAMKDDKPSSMRAP